MMQVSKVVLPAQFILTLMCTTYVQCALHEASSSSPDLSTTIENNLITTSRRIAPINQHNTNHNNSVKRYQIAKFDFEHVSTPYIISLWIIIVGLAKIGFHVTPKLSSLCPESVVLMILGVIIGLIMFFAGIPEDKLQPLTTDLFFLYMLPPIVMDAGYHMPNRLFFDNLISILLYAVIGTVWNALAIGFSLYACANWGLFGEPMPLLDTLLFSSTVSAVDPVAVLAVFEEIHVNEVLYILVFGESLLNDAVTVVLYHMFEGYAEMAHKGGIENVLLIDYFSGFASFFVIALGGTFMGVIWGFLAAFVSRFTHHVKIIEPIFVFVMAYLSYLSAEMFHLSGILSLTFCGITMKNYVEENITQKSHTTLKYAMKMLANSSEAIIFVFLGVCTINDNHRWNTPFVVLTIVFCLVYRTIGVIVLTSLANRFRLHRLNRVEQFIMAYGGLRGAVAFALILVINKKIIHTREMMVTTIIAVVYFTVFLQGMTVGALVKILNVPRANKFELSMNERIHTRLMDHIMAGLEDISGMMVGNYKLRDKFRHFNNKYLRVWLLRDSNEMGNSRKIFETCSKLNLQDAMNIVNKQNIQLTNNNFLSTNKSLSALFRTYTQTNLANISCNEEVSDTSPSTAIPIDQNSSSFNFDIGNLAYSPSNKDLADAEIHHILSDAMFKPVKKVRRYSRSDLSEPALVHPPFQHQIRMQIRHLITQQQHKHHKRKHLHKKANKTDSNESNQMLDNCLENGFISPNSLHVKFAKKDNFLKPESQTYTTSQSQLSADNEDGGIVFTARTLSPESSSSSHPSTSPLQRETSHPSVTVTESTLPWRRSSSEQEQISAQAIRQEEYPPWIDNRDYMPNYASPTNTYLGKLGETKSGGTLNESQTQRTPTVYEIFTILETGENAGRSDSGSSAGSKDNNQNESVTRGRFQCTSASSDDLSNIQHNNDGQQTSPTVAVNLAFENDESNANAIYKL